MRWKEIERIMKENEKWLNMLEEYDRTGKLPLERVRRSFTLKRMNYDKLRRIARERNEKMSRILDRLIEEMEF